jgi:hypothetical protein
LFKFIDLVAYLKMVDSSRWSYLGFLSTNRTTIINSRPFKDNRKGLDGTWWKRFTEAIKKEKHISKIGGEKMKQVILFQLSPGRFGQVLPEP